MRFRAEGPVIRRYVLHALARWLVFLAAGVCVLVLASSAAGASGGSVPNGVSCVSSEACVVWGGAGDGRSATATSYTLSVALARSGSGIVTSSPAGIDCASTCSRDFASGTQVK